SWVAASESPGAGPGRRVERPILRALTEPFDSTETTTVRVDSKALVTIRQNRYWVPVALAGLRVTAAIGAGEIRISRGGLMAICGRAFDGCLGFGIRLELGEGP